MFTGYLKNKNNEIVRTAYCETQEEVQTKLDAWASKKLAGLPERWLHEDDCTEWQKNSAIDVKKVIDKSMTQTEPAEEHIEYLIPAEYTYEIVDISEDYDYKMKKCYEARRAEYGSIEDQLDEIYHDIDGWRNRIKGIKEKHKKPSKN